MIVTLVIFIAIIAIVAYLTVRYLTPPTELSAVYNISKSSLALPNANLPWDMKTPSSLRFGVYITSSPKTMTNVNCTDSLDTTTLTQSCTEYTFTTCACNNVNDCTNCTPDSYLSTLLSLGTCVNFLMSGYIAQSDKPIVSTLLTIKTSSATSTYIESIPLPAIPLQKWTIITLVQEGRRIDVYYGENSVASTYLKYYPIPANRTDMWMAGGMTGMAGWSGSIGLFSYKLTEVSSNDVAVDIENLVDSRGIPYSQNDIDVTFDSIFNFDVFSSCIFGKCSGLPPIKTNNPFAVYASNIS
jgi:hypothetical protein